MGKRVIIRVFTLLSVLALFLNVFLPRASAEVMTHEKYSMDWSYSNSLGKYIRTEMIKNSSGQIAYCLTLGLKSPNGEDLPEMGKTDNVVYRVLLNGFPQKSAEQLGVANKNEAHYATQLAVWNALGQLDVNELKHENKNVEKAAKAIISNANNSEETQDVFMNVIPAEKQKAELKGEFFETNLYSVQTNAKSGSYKVVAKNAPNGVRIVSENGEVKDQLSVGEKFRIQIPKNTKTGEFNLSVAANLTKVQAIAYRGTDTVQNATVLLERNEAKLSSDLAVNWEAAGSLKIKKVGENGEVLADAVFEVFNANNESVGKITTGADGMAELNNLPIGTYTLKEIKAPTGYVSDDKLQTIEVKTGETGAVQIVNNKVKGNIEIKKLSDSGKVLPNVEFTVFTEDGKEVQKVVTKENGIANVEGLTYGKYYFLETKTPNGYIGNKTKYPFEIKEHNKTLTFTVENTEVKGSVKLLKVDNEDISKKLEGAVFELKDESGKVVGEYKTDKNGEINVKDLAYGKYSFVEKASPHGYVLVKEPIMFEIKEHGKIIELLAVNHLIKGDLEITKVDVADGNNKLPNAEFTIYNEVGKEVVKGKTDDKGIAKFEKLPFGKYTYKETVAPKGYVLNEETFSFEIKENGQIIKHIVKDEKIPSIKTTATDKTDGTKEIHTSKSVTIQDKVEYKDLQVGKEYTLKGKLMNKETNKPLVVNGKEVTAETKFTPKEANGSITLDFTFDATGLEEKEVVVFEELLKEGKIVTTHADINDKGQTVKFVKPSVKTTATNKADGGKEIHSKDSITIQDKVEYTNLVVGKEYTVKGKLMNKAINKPLLIDGKEVTAETKFTAKEKNGFVTLDFTFVGAEQQGREVVVFEDLLHEGQVIATHADINDVGQTVRFVEPSIKTTATNKADGSKELDASKSVTIQDKVEYKDLIVGKEYVVKGKLMDKATNKPLLVDGKEVTVESKFIAKEKNGSITLDFTFNASALQGKEVVVFEELYQDNILVAIHAEIEDKEQTVKFKEVKPEQPKPEQPNSDKNTPTPEQPNEQVKEQPQPKQEIQSKIGWLPQTGTNLTSWISMAAGALLLIVGGVIFLKRKNA
ncbi:MULTISPECIES: VaFE repeat-containing surface-anchored protein [Bacillus cereus group]|uniref:VaFE repeat-containing surface-anchored protein n=1 Tax=Bacillus cereus group TaxID=86661 RepID=UPI0007FB50D5|nr:MULTISPECIES: VaFE repeat-containing surface-anchored protein [Bacillus cereus group]MCP1394056.1 TQXA domain-containing protein/LPXTG-motif cell wall-anchored protein [Bacillus cereus]MED3686233.1 VaFE repeat-containing surface-anchored protein [Bacillus thuringiensis]OBW87735.1 collagen-binding protein [Bacillus cereus]PER54578.1 TQXA domain-containing protein [Bacillus thuringiensis]PES53514.1 TQXA domain-containing protein [Bacillus thuringiensis]